MKVTSSPEPTAETPSTIPPEPTNAGIAPSVVPPPMARWPGWVKSIDFAMLALLLVAAFLVASHLARNSDQWLHYASGRALLKGDYSFGTDPFSHATAGRTWVNHSWLYSTVAYLLYNADTTGFVIIAIKAFVFAIVFGIVNLIRRPGQTMWPWILTTLMAVLASAPHSNLRPLIGTGLFLAITLAILLARDWKTGARGNTILLGIVFWLWASTDSWFVLGPLCVALVLLGEWLQSTVLRSKTSTTEDGESISVRPLVRALLIGIVACSVTPHHVRVWQLPYELGFTLPATAKFDEELALLTLSPLDAPRYMDVPSRGNNRNGLAFALLLLGGGVVLAAGFSRVRVSHILLWVVFAALALLQYRMIFLLSIVAIPIISIGLAGFVDRIVLGSLDRPRTKLLLLLSGLGRILGLPAVLLFVLCAYPGWLHPKQYTPGLTQKVAWAVEPDLGLKRSAELLNRWRETGRLPEDYRGLVANLELANHIAWFAPKEKVFANGRYSLHAPEFVDLISARRTLLRRTQPIELSEAEQFREMCHKNNLVYIAYCGTNSPPTSTVDLRPILQLTAPNVGYGLWHVDGRLAVLADMNAKVANEPVFRAMAFDPVRLAFDPAEVVPLPAPPDGLVKPIVEATFLDEFFTDPPKLPALETLDSEVWNILGANHTKMDFQARAVCPFLVSTAFQPLMESYQLSEVATAYRILALRAAYRGLASNPDDPLAYQALAQVTELNQLPLMGLNPEIQKQLHRAGLRQYLDRLPPIQEFRNLGMARIAMQSASELSLLYQPSNSVTNTGRKIPVLPEPGADMFRRMGAYWSMVILPQLPEKEREAAKKELQKEIDSLELMVADANNSYANAIRGKSDVSIRIIEALNRNLLLQAAALFEENWEKQPPPVIVNMVNAYLALGKLNEADFYLRKLEDNLAEAQKEGKLNREMMGIVQATEQQRFLLWQLRGDFAKAGEVIERAPMQPLPPEVKDIVRQIAKQSSSQSLADFMVLSPALAAGGVGIVGQGYLEQCANRWRQQSGFFLSRAMLQILEGKIDDAEVRLRQAIKPDGVELPAFFQERKIAEMYLKLIQRAKSAK